MKRKMITKIMALGLAGAMSVGMLAGCGSSGSSDTSGTTDAGGSSAAAESTGESTNASTDGGTIIWMSNMSSGAQYDAELAYAEAIGAEMGYEIKVVYGDSSNDPDANLTAVKNAMTSDVVGIIASQDGGIQNICEEYPDLYVVGYNTAMDAIYSSDENTATASALKDNDHFLGTIADGYYDGTLTGEQYAEAVIEQGYTKVATITFPAYAYPSLAQADVTFREKIEEYNETADTPIEIVGEVKVLEFSPLDESWFLEEGNGDLDAIVAFCAGTTFVYPTLKQAISDNACSADTKLLTSGFDNDESIIADIGGEGTIQYLTISPTDDIGWAIAMLDKAISGSMYEDYTANECLNANEWVIDSAEDIENVMSSSVIGTGDASYAQVTADQIKACTTYGELKALFASDDLTVDALAN